MLFLLFQIGDDRYALEASQVSEVLPLVDITHLPHAPGGVAGIFDFRGAPVPVIDLSQVTVGRPADRRLSTRLIVVHYREGDTTRLLGLLAERTTATVQREPTDFVDSGVARDGASYLGPVASDAHGFVQWIEVSKLVPAPVGRALFRTQA